MEALPAGEAHVWYVRISSERSEPRGEAEGRAKDGTINLDDRELLGAYEALMSPDERDRYARFVVPDPRLQYVVTRALVRTALSRYTGVDPASWTFSPGPHGRPEITGPAGAPRPHFNLSNTRGLVAIVVASDREVGIDVEDARRTRSLGVADRFFAPAEVAALRRLPDRDQHERFLAYWTLKESYIKARGMGLALPLSGFAFDLDRGIRIAFDERIPDDPESWCFQRLRPTADHPMALALRRVQQAEPRVVVREVLPLRSG